MTTVSRRGLFAMLRGKPPEPAAPERTGEFSLEGFYSDRAPGGQFPHLAPRAAGGAVTATTRVGVTRVVRIRNEDCLATRSFCSVCSERCPVPGAIVVTLGRPRINEVACDGCGTCIDVCPAPTKAIEVLS